MTDVIPNYSELNKEIERQLAEARTKIEGVVQSVFADFLQKFPKVYGVGWTQSTPSWNDGESCEFSVHELNLYLTEEAYEDGDSDQDLFQYRSKPSDDELERVEAVGGEEEFKKILAHFKSVETFFHAIDEDDMQLVFGDGSKVLSTKDGIEVEDYEEEY
jgi:hypothetical protein